jgi:hypothetical protein
VEVDFELIARVFIIPLYVLLLSVCQVLPSGGIRLQVASNCTHCVKSIENGDKLY